MTILFLLSGFLDGVDTAENDRTTRIMLEFQGEIYPWDLLSWKGKMVNESIDILRQTP